MRKTYGLSVLLIVLVAAILESGSRPLRAQSALVTAAATEDQSSCSVQAHIRAIALSPDGKYVVANWKPGTDRLWEVETGKVVQDFFVANYFPQLEDISFSTDGKYVLTAAFDGLTIMWNIATGMQVHVFSIDAPTSGFIRSVAFSRDGKYVLVGSAAGARLWDAQTGTTVGDFPNSGRGRLAADGGHAEFSADGKRILVDGGKVTLWDAQTGESLFADDHFWGSLSADGKSFMMYNGGGDGGTVAGELQLWDSQYFTKIHTFIGDFGTFSPDGKYLWTFTDSDRIALWDTTSGTKLHSFPGSFRGYFFHNHDYLLVSEFTDNATFHAWDTKAGVELWSFTIDESTGDIPVISPDDRYLVVGSEYGELLLRDIQTGAIIRKFC